VLLLVGGNRDVRRAGSAPRRGRLRGGRHRANARLRARRPAD
jgi:hypothetical protein